MATTTLATLLSCSSLNGTSPSSRFLATKSARSPVLLTSFRKSGHGHVKKNVGLVRAQEDSNDASVQAQKFAEDLKAKWDGIEDKGTFLLYTGGAVVAIYLASAIIGAFESLPLLPKFFQLVGIGYSGWFVYRYLLFTPNRQELKQKIEEIKSKIAGE